MKVLKVNLKRILVIMMIFIMMWFFLLNSVVHARSKLPAEGDFYYSGSTQGTYTVTQGIFDWLLENLGAIVDWILGIATMLIRMVFVGWTALIEMLLTWVLETTMHMDTELGNVSATNVSDNTDSSKNVTVEAIVFGLVPMFDINIFNLEIPDNLTATGIDLEQYTCEKCNKGIYECTCNEGTPPSIVRCACTACDLKEAYVSNRPDISTMTCSTCGQGADSCACNTEGNSDCSCEMCNLKNEKSPVLMVKETVAEWYYIIRLIAIAAMLIVLIGIGIKLATASIASDKALYKRMIIDWIAGMIILFSIHYIMIMIINTNDALVKVVREASISSVKDEKNITNVEGSPSFNSPKKTNANIEISLYEEVRTRAYDPKLTDGLTGMVMYATLVYFAVRFSLVYLKRYLTVIVLTLMAPGVAVAYAIQKALTGKSKSFSTWLTEYIMNVIIQIVHAIIYAAFVTMALKLSLESVSGIIIAFVIMNYMLKAEKLFRKIFKMSSKGSLLEATENAGSPESIRGAIRNAQGMAMAAKPIAGVLKKTPITKAAVGLVKAPVKAGVLGGSLVKKKMDEYKENKLQNIMKQDEDYEKLSKDNISAEDKEHLAEQIRDRALLKMHKYTGQKMKIIEKGKELGGYDQMEEDTLRAALYTDQRPLEEGETEEKRRRESVKRWNEYTNARKANKIFKKATNQTTLRVATAHIGKLLDYNNYFIPHEVDGKLKVNPIRDRRKAKWVFDEKTGMPKRIGTMDQLIGNQFSAENLLGFTESDKKQAKQVLKFTAKGLLGVGSTFIGLGTFVAHPKLGMPLLAAGVTQTSTMLGKNKKRIAKPKQIRGNVYLENGFEDVKEEIEEPLRRQRFTFSRFSSGAMITMQEQLMQRVEEDKERLSRENIERIKNKNPKFNKKMKKGKIKPVGKPTYADIELKDIPRAKIYTKDIDNLFEKVTYTKGRPILDSMFGGIAEQMDLVSMQHFSQIQKQQKKEKQVAVAMISEALQDEFMQKYQDLMIPNANPKQQTAAKKSDAKKGSSHPTPITMKTRADITDIKDIATVIEVAILEEASATKRDVVQLDINKGSVNNNVKKTIENILRQNDGINAGQNVEDVVKNIDKEIIDAKARLDKGSKEKKQTIKEILREAMEDEGEKDFIKRVTGFDVDADNDTNVENQKSRPKESSTKGLTKSEENKVVELLLLQKQMRELNAEASKLKMSPLEANKRYEEARTFVLRERQATEARTGENPKTKMESKSYYGPVTDIIELINKL